MNWKGLFAVALVGAALAAPSITADTPPAGTQDFAPGAAAMRAYINPETGALDIGVAPVSSLTIDANTQQALRRDDSGLVEVYHPDGAVSIDLQGRFQNVAVARIGEDGKVRVTGCADDEARLQHALQGQAAAEVK